MKKIIIILSGGMDSTTLLYWFLNKGYKVKALSFNYGQKHKKELEFAKKTCKKLLIDWKLVDISTIMPLISNSSLTSNMKVPEGHYEDKTMKLTVVPNRNMIMLSVAIGYAENLGFKYVAYANHAGDHAIYPDCRSEFVNALNKASILGTYNKIKIIAPFKNITKREIAQKGIKLGINYDNTWSCYKGKNKPCGKCGTCVEKEEALRGL